MNQPVMLRCFSCCLIAGLIMACSSETEKNIPEHVKELENVSIHHSGPEEAGVLTLEPEMDFGETDEVLFNGWINDATVDEQGRVYLVDFRSQKIHAYAPDGSWLTSIGQEGRGPGEFETITAIQAENGRVHVLDGRHLKIAVFEWQEDEVGLVDEFNIDMGQFNRQPGWVEKANEQGWHPRPSGMDLDPDGRYLIRFTDRSVPVNAVLEGRTTNVTRYDPDSRSFTDLDVMAFDWTGQVIVHEVEGGMSVYFGLGYKRDSRIAYRGGQWVYGWNEDFLLRIHDDDGQYIRAVYHSLPNKPLVKDDLLQLNADRGSQFEEMIRNDELPETWPAFQDVLLDRQGRIWVSRISEDPETMDWFILDADGELAGRAQLPSNVRVKYISGDALYAIEQDEDGLPFGRRYRVEG